MLSDVHERLLQVKEQLRKRLKLSAMLKEAEATYQLECQNCQQYEAVLTKEQAEYEALQESSLTGLFYSLLGTKEQRLEKERQEFLAAKLKHEECVAAIQEIQQEVRQLREEYDQLSGIEEEYERLFSQKEQLLTQSSDDVANALSHLTEQLVDLKADQKELQEAYNAGKKAQASLKRVRSELGAAKNWGTWDLMGGGTLSTWAKHSRIDSAKREAHEAQRHLRKFRKELADADQRLHVSLGDMGGFSKFADFFFDGLIADWVVQSKLGNASESCDSALKQVTSIVGQCLSKLTETDRAIQQIEAERQELIEQS